MLYMSVKSYIMGHTVMSRYKDNMVFVVLKSTHTVTRYSDSC